LDGFPLRLIAPGWYSTYWVKMFSDIEVLDAPDTSYWMATAYRIPDTPRASVEPGETGFKTVPINRMVPRSFLTNVRIGDTARAGTVPLRGIAFGGDCGVAQDLNRPRPELAKAAPRPRRGQIQLQAVEHTD